MMKAKIGRVDMNGYCGRDHHPDRTDEGLTVTVVKVSTMFLHEDESDGLLGYYEIGADGRLVPQMRAESDTESFREAVAQYEHAMSQEFRYAVCGYHISDPHTGHAFDAGSGGSFETIYTCRTADGRVLELMPHEIASVTL